MRRDTAQAMRRVGQMAIGTVVSVDRTSEGLLVDIDLGPPVSQRVTARLARSYVGPGYGLFVYPKAGLEALCMLLAGDLNEVVMLAGLNNENTPMPDAVAPDTILLVGAEGTTLDVQIDGDARIASTGNVTLEADGEIQLAAGGEADDHLVKFNELSLWAQKTFIGTCTCPGPPPQSGTCQVTLGAVAEAAKSQQGRLR